MTTQSQLLAIAHLKREAIHWHDTDEFIAHVNHINYRATVLLAQIDDAQMMLDINGSTPNSRARCDDILRQITSLEITMAALATLRNLSSFTPDQGW